MSTAGRFLDRKGFLALVREARRRRWHRNGRRDYFLWVFLGNTGLRISEALALTVADLKLGDDPPWVRVKTLKRRGGEHYDAVYLDEKAARSARNWYRFLHNTLGHLPPDQVPLFPALNAGSWRYGGAGSSPRPMTRSNAHALFQHYARRAQLEEGITLHSLRHYRATVLYQTTRDLEFTQQQLRHTKITTTQGYLHTSPERTRRYLAELARRPKT